MEPVGLTALPVEVIHHISRYLSVQDVLSCSLTCHRMRAALNYNYVWKNYLPQDVSRLKTQKQQVTPAFQLGEELTPLCENREHFMRKTHVLNNWRGGHCVFKYSMRNGHDTIPRTVLLYEDRYILICHGMCRDDCDGLEVWDISESPILYTFFPMENTWYKGFHLVGPYLVVVECINVYVYRIDLPEKNLYLLYSFLIPENTVTLNERVKLPRNHDKRCRPWEHVVVGNYLIGKYFEGTALHIWDIHNASKVGTFEPPIESSGFSEFDCSGKIVFLRYYIHPSPIRYFYAFDTQTLKFSDLNLSPSVRPNLILAHKDCIILFEDKSDEHSEESFSVSCSVYDCNTSLKLSERHFDMDNLSLGPPHVVDDRFVVRHNHDFLIIDAFTLKTVDKFTTGSELIHSISQITVFQTVIVVLQNSNRQLELWDAFKKTKLPIQFNGYTDYLFFDRGMTKLIVVHDDRIVVVHAW